MSDIARDLRAAAYVLLECPEHAETVDGGVLVNLHKRADELNAAADEIERLRAMLLSAEEPAAWAVTMGDGSTYEAFAAHQRGEAEALANECRFGNKSLPLPLAPLYLRTQPALTAEERKTIEWFSRLSYGDGGPLPTYCATLRAMLERTK
jgi:hypothetical protein